MSLREKPNHLSDLPREEAIARIRDGILAARDDVVGIMIFGSFAREKEWRDVDVMVVLRERIPSRAAWAEIAVQLTNATGLIEIDLIPTWLTGLRRGLSTHRPLLMEIAFDGLVIYDRADIAGFLGDARREIGERGIRRTSTGWRFPVKYRQPSPLSPKLNDERAQRWRVDAQRDLAVAEELKEKGFFDRSVYPSQQSTERSVKAVLICFGAFERVHRVGRILLQEIRNQHLPGWRGRLEQLASHSLALEAAAIDAWYIDDEGEEVYLPWEHYFEADAAKAIDSARDSLAIAREFVEWWFASGPEPSEEPPPASSAPGDESP